MADFLTICLGFGFLDLAINLTVDLGFGYGCFWCLHFGLVGCDLGCIQMVDLGWFCVSRGWVEYLVFWV